MDEATPISPWQPTSAPAMLALCLAIKAIAAAASMPSVEEAASVVDSWPDCEDTFDAVRSAAAGERSCEEGAR